MMNKKAMSAIIAVMILIVIVLAGTGIIWNIVNKVVDEGLDEAKSCYDLLGKVAVNSKYTCYDMNKNEMYVSIEVGDINIDGLFMVIEDETSSVSFELTNEPTDVGLKNYDRTSLVKVPGKNTGVTYIATNIIETPLLIKIAPKINGNLCDGDTFTNIGFCSS